uniref:E4 n=1 Tax=Human papillomavirus 40 TaxID=10615 RepID=A0A159DWL1_HPV40|nr:E4 [human papillomavirus 40]
MGKQIGGLLLWVHTLYVLLVLSRNKDYPLLRLLTPDPRPLPPTPQRPPKRSAPPRHRPESDEETDTCPSPLLWANHSEESTWTLQTEHARLTLKATTGTGTVVEVLLHL